MTSDTNGPEAGPLARPTPARSTRRDIIKYDQLYEQLFQEDLADLPPEERNLPRLCLVTLVKSTIGRVPKHRRTAKALGLTRLGKTVIHELSDPIKGMLNQISYLVDIEFILPRAESPLDQSDLQAQGPEAAQVPADSGPESGAE